MAALSGEDSANVARAVIGLTLVKGYLGLSYTFIVQQYIGDFLQQGYLVVLVTAEQSFERYKYALKKMGLHLQPFLQSGQLHVVEPPLASLNTHPLTFILETSATATAATPQLSSTVAVDGHTASSVNTLSAVDSNNKNYCSKQTTPTETYSALERLFMSVCRGIEQQQQQFVATGVAVIFDSLTALAALRVSDQDWSAFLHYCCGSAAGRVGGRTSSEQQRKVPYCVIAGAYDDVPEDASWLASLEHRSNMVVKVEPLPGRIADVDGMVTLTRRQQFDTNAKESSTKVSTPGEAPPAYSSSSMRPGGCLWGGASSVAPPWLRKTVYFKSSELVVRWLDRVTDRELL